MGSMKGKQVQIDAALGRLADMFDGGHLLASADPVEFLDTVIKELQYLRNLMKWTPISIPPDMPLMEYGWPMSEPKLGITKAGRMLVVTHEQLAEDCEATWISACSERWDVSKELTHWMDLPQLP